ncbi:hypothetical protein CLOM_g18996 [Closterium sp. NIES-68]|nr:hypothetical protein CLOM_g18996 [Closterium sp. NIES-68]GJP66163.1 hypothetical protein CLOP_g23069 [Closterium sp. NIES-67]
MSASSCGFFSGVSGSTRQLAPAPVSRSERWGPGKSKASFNSRHCHLRVNPFLAGNWPSVLPSIKRSSSSASKFASTTAVAASASSSNQGPDSYESSAHAHGTELIDRDRAVTPSSTAIESFRPASPAVTPPRTEAVARLPSPKVDRRTLLGLGLATLAATGAAELGLVEAALAKTQEPLKKQPMWFLGDAAGGVDGEGGLLGKSGPGASKTRVYDATTVGEPALVGDKAKAWEKLLAAKVVYLGEAEVVRDPTDKVVALEILRTLRDESFAAGRPVTLALSAFPRSMQPLLDKFIAGRLPEDELHVAVNYWPKGRLQEMLPLLRYCREAGVRLFACGVPPKVLRTVQAGGVQALSPSDRKKYAPPLGGGSASAALVRPDSATSAVPSYGPSSTSSAFGAAASGISSLSGGNGGLLGIEPIANAAEPLGSRASSATRASFPFGPGPYWFAQARVVEDHAMAGAISQAMSEGGKTGLLVVLTGASHVRFGTNGRGVPSRVADWLRATPSSQAVVLLNPERQRARLESDFPEADFFWYSGSWACTRNCFDRAEIARVMGAAGRTPDALPRDLQVGIERGLISPDTLQSFFELETNPLVAEATKRFQGLRERFYADPRFLQRLCTEEAISIATSLAAQFQKRGDRFWSELEYVSADILRGTVVNFFSVWLPAPRLSFRDAAGPAAQAAAGAAGAAAAGPAEKLLGGLTAWMSTLPHNAFQMAGPGQNFGIAERLGTVVVAGTKLFSVGFVSSVATLTLTNFLADMKNKLPADSTANSSASSTANGTASSADHAALGLVSTPLAAETAAAGAAGGAAAGSGTAAAATGAGAGGAGNTGGSIVPRSPVFKTALVYGAFLSTSANLRYQAIAGIVEHWIADYYLASNPVAGTAVSFLARTANSYWGTSQWVDLARFTGLQQSPKPAAEAQPAAAAAAALPAGTMADGAALAGAEASAGVGADAAMSMASHFTPTHSPSQPELVSQPFRVPALAGAFGTVTEGSFAASSNGAVSNELTFASQMATADSCPASGALATAAAAADVIAPSVEAAFLAAEAVSAASAATSAGVEDFASGAADVAALPSSAAADVAELGSGAADVAASAPVAADVAAVVEFGSEAVAAAQAGARLVPVEVLSDRDVLNYHQQQQQQQHN